LKLLLESFVFNDAELFGGFSDFPADFTRHAGYASAFGELRGHLELPPQLPDG
jgi:hypothetical protein